MISELVAQPRTLILTNTPAPYRLPVFEALGADVALTVYFAEGHDPERLWQVTLKSERVHYQLGQARRLPGGLVWNSDMGALLRPPFDAYIVGDNFTSVLSILRVWWTARRRHKPFIIWCEALDTAYASGNAISNAYRRWLYPRTTAFIAFGQRTRAYVLARSANPARIVEGLQVVPAEQIPPATQDKAALGLTGKTVVLYVGYFVERKGLDQLIAVFREVADPDARLVLAGSGPLENMLRLLSHGDERILFPGYLDGAAKSNWYAAADVFVLPTLHDPWGLVVNEAMAFGLPIIATEAAGCVPDLVRDQVNGLVVPPNNVPALSAAIKQLLNDTAVRQMMGQQSRSIIAGFTIEAAAHRFKQVIDHAVLDRV